MRVSIGCWAQRRGNLETLFPRVLKGKLTVSVPLKAIRISFCLSLFKKKFCWHIVDLQCCVSFCRTAK